MEEVKTSFYKNNPKVTKIFDEASNKIDGEIKVDQQAWFTFKTILHSIKII